MSPNGIDMHIKDITDEFHERIEVNLFIVPSIGSVLNTYHQSKEIYHDYNSKFKLEIFTPEVKEEATICTEKSFHEIDCVFIGKQEYA